MTLRLIACSPARFVPDPAEQAAETNMAPLAAIADCGGQVGDLLVGLNIIGDILVEEAEAPRIDVVGGMLEGDSCGEPIPVPEGPADLRVAQPGHSRRPPIFQAVG